MHISRVHAAGGFVGWLVNTFFSAVLGLIVGAIVVAVVHLLPFGKKHDEHADEPTQADAAEAIKAAHIEGPAAE